MRRRESVASRNLLVGLSLLGNLELLHDVVEETVDDFEFRRVIRVQRAESSLIASVRLRRGVFQDNIADLEETQRDLREVR